MFDLFAETSQTSDFSWVVALFAGHGILNVIQRANEVELRTYYPIRFNGRGDPIPLWRPYLFIEFRESLTLEICRTTRNFLKILSMRDDDGKEYPIKVRKDAINYHIAMLMKGKFNDKTYVRRRYGIGSIVRVIEGNFIDKRVKLNEDIEPTYPGTKKIAIEINGLKGSIELWKLAL